MAITDLAIEGNRVVVTLARDGTTPVDMAEAAKLQLEVRAGVQRWVRPLMQLDPDLKAINGRGGQVIFGTDLELEKTGPVMARLIGGEGKALTRMLSSNGKPAMALQSQARLVATENGPIGLAPPEGKPLALAHEIARKPDAAQAGALESDRVPLTLQEGAKPIASSLPIEILSPGMNGIVPPGGEVTVRYRIGMPTDTGDVAFRLVDESGALLAETTHRFEPQTIPDLGGARLTPTGSGLITPAPPAEGAPMGIGDLAFVWRMPEELVPESTCRIEARKGTLLGRSAALRVRGGEQFTRRFIGGGDLRISIEGGERIWHPGDRMIVHVDILGDGISGFSSPEDYRMGAYHGVFLYPADRTPTWGGEHREVISRSADMRSITFAVWIPEETEWHAYYSQTDRFALSFHHHEGPRATLAPIIVRPSGIGESGIAFLEPAGRAIWPLGSEQRIAWRMFGYAEPGDLHFSLRLNGHASPSIPLHTNDVRCTWATDGLCSKTITVDTPWMEAHAVPAGSSAGFTNTIELTVRRDNHFGAVLATARSGQFAITRPHIAVVSPAAGDVLPLFNPVTVRFRVSGGAHGPFQVQIQNPSLGLVPLSFGPFACSACPSAEIQEVTATFPVDVELLHQAGRTFVEGIGGFKAVVTSSSEPGLMGESGEFTMRHPRMWVHRPEVNDSWRRGEDRLIRWEIDMPTSVYGYQRLVDIELLNVATNRRWTIAEAVPSEDLHGRRVQGHTRWHVDQAAGRYLVTVRMHRFFPDLQASSGIFTIE